MLSALWRTIYGTIDSAVTSTSIRRGTICMMKRNRAIRKEDRNYRSGHKDESRAEEHDETEAVDTLPGMKVLTGYKDVRGTNLQEN